MLKVILLVGLFVGAVSGNCEMQKDWTVTKEQGRQASRLLIDIALKSKQTLKRLYLKDKSKSISLTVEEAINIHYAEYIGKLPEIKKLGVSTEEGLLLIQRFIDMSRSQFLDDLVKQKWMTLTKAEK